MNTPLPPIVSQLVEASRQGFRPPLDAERGDAYALRHGLPFCVSDATRRQAHVAHVMDGLSQLLELSSVFERVGIAHAWLKGPVFAQWLYADPGARRFSDLDLLVRTVDRDRALATLQSLGFERRIPPRPGAVIYASIGALPVMRAGRIGVDLHWQLAGRRFPQTLTAEDVIGGAQRIEVAGREVASPCAEHITVMHLSHAAKHLFYALEHTLSTAMLMRRRDIDWAEVHGILSTAGAVRAGAAGLQLAHE
ncbi:MAG TPA: nucleotidyltransferase family protein, partial [Vicinamibacterales bacterium]